MTQTQQSFQNLVTHSLIPFNLPFKKIEQILSTYLQGIIPSTSLGTPGRIPIVIRHFHFILIQGNGSHVLLKIVGFSKTVLKTFSKILKGSENQFGILDLEKRYFFFAFGHSKTSVANPRDSYLPIKPSNFLKLTYIILIHIVHPTHKSYRLSTIEIKPKPNLKELNIKKTT